MPPSIVLSVPSSTKLYLGPRLGGGGAPACGTPRLASASDSSGRPIVRRNGLSSIARRLRFFCRHPPTIGSFVPVSARSPSARPSAPSEPTWFHRSFLRTKSSLQKCWEERRAAITFEREAALNAVPPRRCREARRRLCPSTHTRVPTTLAGRDPVRTAAKPLLVVRGR